MGDSRSFEPFVHVNAIRSVAIHKMEWVEFIPTPLLGAWKELHDWKPAPSNCFPEGKEWQLYLLIRHLHAARHLPWRPLTIPELLADVELVFVSQFAP